MRVELIEEETAGIKGDGEELTVGIESEVEQAIVGGLKRLDAFLFGEIPNFEGVVIADGDRVGAIGSGNEILDSAMVSRELAEGLAGAVPKADDGIDAGGDERIFVLEGDAEGGLGVGDEVGLELAGEGIPEGDGAVITGGGERITGGRKGDGVDFALSARPFLEQRTVGGIENCDGSLSSCYGQSRYLGGVG